jgi:hypothetical protein
MMDERRVKAMVIRIAQGETTEGVEDEPFGLVDQSIDMMIQCVQCINDNLPKVEAQNVPQKAALDEIRGILDEGVAPYLADMVKVWQVVEGGA